MFIYTARETNKENKSDKKENNKIILIMNGDSSL